jgi:hypothetical protein
LQQLKVTEKWRWPLQKVRSPPPNLKIILFHSFQHFQRFSRVRPPRPITVKLWKVLGPNKSIFKKGGHIYVTEKQIAANRETGKLSHGALSPETKQKCSMNALKHGLFSAKVLLPNDDVAAYESLVATIFAHHKPVTDAEKLVIQSPTPNGDSCASTAPNLASSHSGHLKNQTAFPDGTDPISNSS